MPVIGRLCWNTQPEVQNNQEPSKDCYLSSQPLLVQNSSKDHFKRLLLVQSRQPNSDIDLSTIASFFCSWLISRLKIRRQVHYFHKPPVNAQSSHFFSARTRKEKRAPEHRCLSKELLDGAHLNSFREVFGGSGILTWTPIWCTYPVVVYDSKREERRVKKKFSFPKAEIKCSKEHR